MVFYIRQKTKKGYSKATFYNIEMKLILNYSNLEQDYQI